MISALFIDPLGVYPKLGLDCWDEKRNAHRFIWANPVIAHPPCGPWGKMRTLCTRQKWTSGPFAVSIVRKNGGILEHPQFSTLWDYCGLPKPGEPADEHGGFTVEVDQVAWGHTCRKPTWLYMVGVDRLRIRIKRGGTPTHVLTTWSVKENGKRVGYGRNNLEYLPVASKRMKRQTPLAFAKWLIQLVQTIEP